MAKLRADQIEGALKKSIAPVYLVTGDEPLLVQEACDSIRSIAKDKGFIERELHHTDSGFQWSELTNSANAMSLFAEKKIIEIRVHNGKPGDDGSKAICEYCENPGDDNVLLLIMPKIDKRSQNTKWYKAIDKVGGVITIWPISAGQLPRWVGDRIKAAGLRADREAVEVLCAKIEGNLLAAKQEIDKLRLVATDKPITANMMADAVTDSARYDVFGLIDKALAGDARAAATCLQGLRSEGTEPTLILWALAREIRLLASIKESMENGKSFDFAAKNMGVWDNRKPLIKNAAYRLHLRQLHVLIRKSSQADRTIKGLTKGDVWNLFLDIVLSVSGTEVLSGASLKLSLQANV